MPSIETKHSRSCPCFPSTRGFDKPVGCNCQPTYNAVIAEGAKRRRERLGKDRQTAERAFRKLSVQVDEGSYQPVQNIRFSDWADQWRESLQRAKENTRNSYVSTLDYGKRAFGDKKVRHLTTSDVSCFLTLMDGISPSTKRKHLRVLHACLGSAVEHGYAALNPVEKLPDSEKPLAEQREPAYFENDELPRLFAAIVNPLWRVLFLTALKTGMRQGELAALTWADVSLTEARIRVRRNYTAGQLSTPKSGKSRDVELTDEVVKMLGEWWHECGSPDDDKLVFPGGGRDGYVCVSTITQRGLYPALTAAGIMREGPTGEKRTFHSFRHTFAKRALESGASLSWLSKHLGHSSTAVTDRVYGRHWERAESRKQLSRLEGAFAGCEYGVSTGLPLQPAISTNGLGEKSLVNPGLPA